MKTIIIIANIITALSVTGWFILTVFQGFGNPNGNGGATPSQWHIVWVVAIIGLLSIVFSHSDHSKKSLIWALIPVVSVIVYVSFFYIQEHLSGNSLQQARKDSAARIMNDTPRDFICKNSNENIKEVFLTIDKTTGFLVELRFPIDTTYVSVIPRVLGKVENTTLLLPNKNRDATGFESCVDSDGKTIFDKFKIKYNQNVEYSNADLQKYKPLLEN